MNQYTKYLHLNIGGITNEPCCPPNLVDNLIALDEAVHNAEEGPDITALTARVATLEGKMTTAEGKITTLEGKVAAIEAALAKTGAALTVEGLSNGVLTAGGYVAVADPEPDPEQNEDDNR